MLFIAMLSMIVIFFILCIVIIRCRAIRVHKELKESLISLSNHYNGTFKDMGYLEEMSLKFNFNNFHVVCKTIIECRRKYTNSYSLLISLIDNSSKITLCKKKMRLGDAIHKEKLMAVISSMFVEQIDEKAAFT